MTTQSQKRKAVKQIVSGEFESSFLGNNTTGNPNPGPSESPKLHFEDLDEVRTSRRQKLS